MFHIQARLLLYMYIPHLSQYKYTLVYNYLDKYHHKLWEEIEDDWDKIYPEIEIDVVVDVKIRRRGITK